ncbi:ribonuclease H [Psychroflexus sp. S27]|uniref:ribonuclease H1 domain-containing protein n=1 Tax=Psychroflexus sp. S27 TaxID=1982757 RepID=UPI000C2A7820|nr:ribonuclease H family protein [Psychroflexus sp. S27]PJX21603.1 ribonuclease H [Psychroflexus sp. S27]
MAKKKFYVVWDGWEPGIYKSWDECKKMIKNYKSAKYKSFKTLEEAQSALQKGFFEYHKTKDQLSAKALEEINFKSISVDAASSGNPGKMEYRGVITKTKEELFKIGPFEQGTNNIGEFLALVHGLAFLKSKNSQLAIYSDSKIAMSWVRQKKCKTKLQKNAKNAKVFELIKRAENWLKTNTYSTTILKWNTKEWGEIPADFGRK